MCKAGLAEGWEIHKGGAWRPINGVRRTHPSTDMMKTLVAQKNVPMYIFCLQIWGLPDTQAHGEPGLRSTAISRLNNGVTNCFTILTVSMHILFNPVISLLESCPANNILEQNDKCTGLLAAALLVTEKIGSISKSTQCGPVRSARGNTQQPSKK